MKLIEFPEQNTVFAESQSEYFPLPAYRFNDTQGRIACCWELNWRDRISILFGGKIWHQILTFNKLLQPQLLTINKPTFHECKTTN